MRILYRHFTGVELLSDAETGEIGLFGYGGPILDNLPKNEPVSMSMYVGTVWGLKQTVANYEGPFVNLGIFFPFSKLPFLGLNTGLFMNPTMSQHGNYSGITIRFKGGLSSMSIPVSASLTYFKLIRRTIDKNEVRSKACAKYHKLFNPISASVCLKAMGF